MARWQCSAREERYASYNFIKGNLYSEKITCFDLEFAAHTLCSTFNVDIQLRPNCKFMPFHIDPLGCLIFFLMAKISFKNVKGWITLELLSYRLLV